MNLYFFEDENVLEMEYGEDGPPTDEVEEYALKVLLPALGARDVEPCDGVD